MNKLKKILVIDPKNKNSFIALKCKSDLPFFTKRVGSKSRVLGRTKNRQIQRVKRIDIFDSIDNIMSS